MPEETWLAILSRQVRNNKKKNNVCVRFPSQEVRTLPKGSARVSQEVRTLPKGLARVSQEVRTLPKGSLLLPRVWHARACTSTRTWHAVHGHTHCGHHTSARTQLVVNVGKSKTNRVSVELPEDHLTVTDCTPVNKQVGVEACMPNPAHTHRYECSVCAAAAVSYYRVPAKHPTRLLPRQ